MAEKVLEVNSLSKSYRSTARNVEVLKNISFAAEAGRSYAIMGESGAGKSTLLSILAGLQKPDSGSVLYHNGRNTLDISELADTQLAILRRHDIVYISQFQDVIPELTLSENVRLVDCFDDTDTGSGADEADVILTRLGLCELRDELPENLSGGEIRRLTIARALYAAPNVLLLDEPTNDLDSENRRIVTETLQDLSGQGITVIVATHDDALAASVNEIIEIAGL